MRLAEDDFLLVEEEKELVRKREALGHCPERKDISIRLCGLRRQIKAQVSKLRGQKAVEDQRALHHTNEKISIHALRDFRNVEDNREDHSDIL